MVDRYTKIVLTIIAANLTVVTLQGLNLIPQAIAKDNGIQKVAVCQFDRPDRCAEVRRGSVWVKP